MSADTEQKKGPGSFTEEEADALSEKFTASWENDDEPEQPKPAAAQPAGPPTGAQKTPAGGIPLKKTMLGLAPYSGAVPDGVGGPAPKPTASSPFDAAAAALAATHPFPTGASEKTPAQVAPEPPKPDGLSKPLVTASGPAAESAAKPSTGAGAGEAPKPPIPRQRTLVGIKAPDDDELEKLAESFADAPDPVPSSRPPALSSPEPVKAEPPVGALRAPSAPRVAKAEKPVATDPAGARAANAGSAAAFPSGAKAAPSAKVQAPAQAAKAAPNAVSPAPTEPATAAAPAAPTAGEAAATLATPPKPGTEPISSPEYAPPSAPPSSAGSEDHQTEGSVVVDSDATSPGDPERVARQADTIPPSRPDAIAVEIPPEWGTQNSKKKVALFALVAVALLGAVAVLAVIGGGESAPEKVEPEPKAAVTETPAPVATPESTEAAEPAASDTAVADSAEQAESEGDVQAEEDSEVEARAEAPKPVVPTPKPRPMLKPKPKTIDVPTSKPKPQTKKPAKNATQKKPAIVREAPF